MCLTTKFSLEGLKELLDLIPKEGKVVYKVVGVARGKYYPVAVKTRTPFKVGSDSADTHEPIITSYGHKYKAGFHFFQIKKEAEETLQLIRYRTKNIKRNKIVRSNMREANELIRKEYKVIECRIKRSWVTAVGLDGADSDSVTIVAKKAIFPDPKDEK
jgi:hypothetical protein